jgi:YVTN family beta-propeller protein
MTSTYSNQVIPIEINPRDVVTTIGKIQGVNLVDNPLYMSNGTDTFHSIDSSTNTIINTITIASSDVNNILVSPNGNTLYSIDDVANTAHIVSLLTGTLSGTVIVGSVPLYQTLSHDGSILYVSNYTSHTISVISTSLQKVIATIATNADTSGMAISPNDTILYVACDTNVVNVIDTTTYSIITSIAVSGAPTCLQLVDNGKKLYVSQVTGSSLSCINTTTNTIIATITVGTNPTVMVVTPDQQYLYVANETSGTISVIATDTNTVLTTITTAPANGLLAISEDGLRVYNGLFTGNIYVISTVTNAVLTTIVTPATGGIMTSPLARFLCGQGRLTLIVDEQVGANKTFQFELTGGIINTSGTPLQNYSYIDNSNKNCSITVNVPNNIQLTTTYGSTFSFQFYPYTSINPTIHRLVRGGGVASGEVRVTVRDYVSKIVW